MGFSIFFFLLLSSSFQKIGATDVILHHANHGGLKEYVFRQQNCFAKLLKEEKWQKERFLFPSGPFCGAYSLVAFPELEFGIKGVYIYKDLHLQRPRRLLDKPLILLGLTQAHREFRPEPGWNPSLLTFMLLLWTGQTWDQKSPMDFLKKLHSRDRSLATSLFLAFLPHMGRILVQAREGHLLGSAPSTGPGVSDQTWTSQPQIWASPGLAVFPPALQSWEGRPGKTYPFYISEGQWDPALPPYTVERTSHHPSVRSSTGHVKESEMLSSHYCPCQPPWPYLFPLSRRELRLNILPRGINF